MLLLLSLACTAPADVELLAYDADRSGLNGEDGPYGVRLTPAFGGDPPSDTFVPLDENGDPANARGVVVLLHGGAVVAERYHWLAQHLASTAMVVLTPHHPFDLAIFDTTAGNRAYAAAVDAGVAEPGLPIAIMGHSLGGVVSAMQWVGEDPSYTGLALLASYPAEETDLESREGPVLFVIGDADAKTDLTLVEDAFASVDQTALVHIDGMNHMDWADDATEAELAEDGVSTRPQSETRGAAQAVIDQWLSARVLGEEPEALVLDPDLVVVEGEL